MIAQTGNFELRGRIYSKNKTPLEDVMLQVFEDDKKVNELKSASNGSFLINFELNKSYLLEISKQSFVSKRVIIITNVPEAQFSDNFDLFSLIILNSSVNDDESFENELPAVKYYYHEPLGRFMAEKLDNIVTIKKEEKDSVKYLLNELTKYKILIKTLKNKLSKSDKELEAANVDKQKLAFSDSLKRIENKKLLELIKSLEQQQITNIVSTNNEKDEKIANKEFKDLSVNKEEFNQRKEVQELQKKYRKLNKISNKTRKDSLNLKKNRLKLRKELFEVAKYQLEIDRLTAITEEDKLKIENREAQLALMEQQIILAEQELNSANDKLELKELEIRNKNNQLISFVVGTALLLILLVIIYLNYRNKKKTNAILEYQNHELEKLSIVASETSNAVIITNEKGDYTWVNNGYTRLFGFTSEEITGEKAKNIFIDDCLISNEEDLKRALINGESVNYEMESETKSGNKIWIQTTITPILSNKNTISKLIVINSDISEIKEAEKEIVRQNHQIMDSINYGKRIQDAILPSESFIKSYFPESFIYFKPRDIVSGDFYWFSVQDDRLFVAAVDCTGHGVPGAFMSLIGNSLLNHIVNERKIHKPSEILKELNLGVIKALSQSRDEGDEREDGMDLTICRFDKNEKTVQIACANHTAIIVDNEEVKEIEGDEISIGETFSKVDNLEFTNHEISFKENSTLFLFSDGFPDQLGGPKKKKFLYGKFIKLLEENQLNDISNLTEKLNSELDNWKGTNKQTDDILVMGIRL